jgi:WXG100 family type VII secretion target
MLDGLRLDYEQLRAVAADVRQRMADSQAVISTVRRETASIRPLWAGAARAAFDQAFEHYEREVQHVPRMLEQVAQALTDTAQLVQQAEQRAKGGINQAIQNDTAG